MRLKAIVLCYLLAGCSMIKTRDDIQYEQPPTTRQGRSSKNHLTSIPPAAQQTTNTANPPPASNSITVEDLSLKPNTQYPTPPAQLGAVASTQFFSSSTDAKTIGVVLPMSGNYGPIAQKTLRGLEMGLGLYDSKPSSFKIAIADGGDDPEKARLATASLITNDNTIAIVGGLLSKTSTAVSETCKSYNVPNIALSQKSGLTDIGPTIFRNTLTAEQQVAFLVKNAMEKKNLKRFAIIYPNDAYGVEYANLFWDEVLARGGGITGAQSYSEKETDFKEAVQKIVGTYYKQARAKDYKAAYNEWKKKNPNNKQVPEDLLEPVVDFDAIFIPDSAKTLGQVSAMLAYSAVKDVYLLGTNLWNTPDIEKRAGHFAKTVMFVDSFTADNPHYKESSFVQDYQRIFRESPGSFEIQAYDSGLMLRQLIGQGNMSRDSLTRALADVKNIDGAISTLHMGPNKDILRPLVALTIDNGHVAPLDR